MRGKKKKKKKNQTEFTTLLKLLVLLLLLLQIFRPKSTVQPEFDKDTATKFFAEAYADKQREHEFEHFEDLPPPPTLSFTVKTSPPSFESLEAVLRSRRNSSAPGPNGI